jgi:hypothetical protein
MRRGPETGRKKALFPDPRHTKTSIGARKELFGYLHPMLSIRGLASPVGAVLGSVAGFATEFASQFVDEMADGVAEGADGRDEIGKHIAVLL